MDNPKAQSRLLALSPELRHAIWAFVLGCQVHFGADATRTRLSACLDPRPNPSDDGYERRTTGDVDTDGVWARRLQSAWGEHWACEELTADAESPFNRDRAALMGTCRQVYHDVWCVLLDTATFHTTDIHALGEALRSKSDHKLLHLRRLCISARVSLLSFKMDIVDAQDLEPPRAGSAVLDDTQWSAACETLARLDRLAHLHLHLDHDDPLSYWTCIDERKLLSQIPRLSNTRITISLPLLHPGAERPEHHFTDDSHAPDGFTIQRRLRQAYYVEDPTCLTGSFCITQASDFPLLRDTPPYKNFSLQDVIDHERDMWKHAIANGHAVKLERQSSIILEEQFGDV